MTRRLFTLAALLSLALFLATATLWVRSYRGQLKFAFSYRGNDCQALLSAGRMEVSNSPAVMAEAAQRRRDMDVMISLSGAEGQSLLALAPSKVSPWAWSSKLALPLLTLLLAVAPALAVAARIRRSPRGQAAVCLTCGYNLTGNTSGVCPECGADVSAEAKP
jgi:hypothetical protein